jgi:hypothetical protein
MLPHHGFLMHWYSQIPPYLPHLYTYNSFFGFPETPDTTSCILRPFNCHLALLSRSTSCTERDAANNVPSIPGVPQAHQRQHRLRIRKSVGRA